MRTLLATLTLLAAIAPASAASPSSGAISRYSSTSMSCAEIQSRIKAEGAVVLRYQSNGMPRFGRYVDSIRQCTQDEVVSGVSVPASDTSSCSVKMCVDAR